MKIRILSLLFLKIYLIAFSCFSRNINGFEISTCCPKGQEVQGRYCIARNIEDKSLEIFGYQIIQSKVNTIPKCTNPKIEEIIPGISSLSERETCVTSTSDSFLSVNCPMKNPFKSTVINFIKKCCPADQHYNSLTNQCEFFDPARNYFENLLDHPTMFLTGNLECPKGNVVVHYFSENFPLKFQGASMLVVDHLIVEAENYCIEAIVDGIKGVINSTSAYFSSMQQKYVARVCLPQSAICKDAPCVRRCCMDNEKMLRQGNETVCRPFDAILDVEFVKKQDKNEKSKYHVTEDQFRTIQPPKAYGIVQFQDCRKYRLTDNDDFYFTHDNQHAFLMYEGTPYDEQNYCTEYVQMGASMEIFTFVCFVEIEVPKFLIFPYLMFVSCFCLFVTLVVYLSLPKLYNLHGKTLICYILCLLTAFLMLAISQIMHKRFSYCEAFGYMLYFCFMAAFSWLSVMCFDIWWTFGSVERSQKLQKVKEIRRFVLYSLYAWLLPVVFTVITFCVDRNLPASNRFKPTIGRNRCWFEIDQHGPANAVFFLTPMGCFTIANLIFFILTTKYCIKVKNEIHRLQSTNTDKNSLKKRLKADKATFAMTSKLFTVMGISWILEILSTIFKDYQNFFYVVDVFNILQGILIFIIFIIKRRVWEAVKVRFGLQPTKSRYQPTTTTTGMSATSLSAGSADRLRTHKVNVQETEISLLKQKVLPEIKGIKTVSVSPS